jgi:hypothetical protein
LSPDDLYIEGAFRSLKFFYGHSLLRVRETQNAGQKAFRRSLYLLRPPDRLCWRFLPLKTPAASAQCARPGNILATRHNAKEENTRRKVRVVNRREFLAALMATGIVPNARGLAARPSRQIQAGHNLVPEGSSGAPNYWCTWSAQNYMYGHNLQKLDPKVLEGNSGSKLAHDALTETVLFGERGWVADFFPKIRNDLFFLLDDGWQARGTATFELDAVKFPTFQGSFADRLKGLNHAIVGAGWRGTALWCRNTPGGDADRRLESLSQSAGIRYWKVDIGDPAFNLIRVRNEAAIPLTLEHVHGEWPVNGNWRRDGRFGSQPWGSKRMEIMSHTDVFRTYDVTSILSLPTTLDRLAEMLKGAEGRSEVHGLLNVEDEVYVAAAMGCTMGIMRHPLIGMRPGQDADLFFNGSRQTKRRMDEVVRAVRWQRIAPPFSPGVSSVKLSDEILTDSWIFERGQTWQNEIIETEVRQGAPACLARGISLPEVKANGDKPFVFATRFPNGAVAIAAQERTQVGKAWYMPACEVTLSVTDSPGPFGVFGYFESLNLIFDEPLSGKRFLAQDLAGNESVDISSEVQIHGASLHIPGRVIRKVGLQNGTAGDLSAPGLVIAIV